MRNDKKILIRKPQMKRHLRVLGIVGDNIKTDLRETAHERME
jgi:hypothetical protein